MVVGGVVHEFSDEELLATIAAGPGYLPTPRREGDRRGCARRFSTPEDVADFVANVFLEVMESAGSYDPRRGNAVDGLNTGAAAKVLGVTAVATRVRHNHHGGEVIAKGPGMGFRLSHRHEPA
jgi:hypothetical protein